MNPQFSRFIQLWTFFFCIDTFLYQYEELQKPVTGDRPSLPPSKILSFFSTVSASISSMYINRGACFFPYFTRFLFEKKKAELFLFLLLFLTLL